MSEWHTRPLVASRLPLPSLRVEVLEGPDAGRSAVAQGETLSVGTADGNDLVLKDPTVSRFHLVLTVQPNGIHAEDHRSTNGTRVGSVQIERAVLQPGASVQLGNSVLRVGRGEHVSVELIDGHSLAGLVGGSPAMRRLLAQVQRAAQNDTPVLVTGESGTGKELVARALHELGKRAPKPLVTVDCGALAPTLVASELFGHERGAFTGAERQHVGAFERAEGGTIFLDEVGELPAALQATLLGVLERKRFRRLGGTKELTTDVRIVSATHRDLRSGVNAGTFRLDLYYRLAVVVLTVPALRERADDVPLLVEHFLRECGHDGAVDEVFSPQAMNALCAHRWRGNVRELRNLVEATVAMGEAPVLDRVSTVPGASGSAPTESASGWPFPELLGATYKEARASLLDRFEKEYLSSLLARAEGNVSRAAREAQLDRSHLTDLLRRHSLK